MAAKALAELIKKIWSKEKILQTVICPIFQRKTDPSRKALKQRTKSLLARRFKPFLDNWMSTVDHIFAIRQLGRFKLQLPAEERQWYPLVIELRV